MTNQPAKPPDVPEWVKEAGEEIVAPMLSFAPDCETIVLDADDVAGIILRYARPFLAELGRLRADVARLEKNDTEREKEVAELKKKTKGLGHGLHKRGKLP